MDTIEKTACHCSHAKEAQRTQEIIRFSDKRKEFYLKGRAKAATKSQTYYN